MSKTKTNPADDQPKAPEKIEVRIGHRNFMTSLGIAGAGQRLAHGIAISLPAHEAENLLNLGYVSRV